MLVCAYDGVFLYTSHRTAQLCMVANAGPSCAQKLQGATGVSFPFVQALVFPRPDNSRLDTVDSDIARRQLFKFGVPHPPSPVIVSVTDILAYSSTIVLLDYGLNAFSEKANGGDFCVDLG